MSLAKHWAFTLNNYTVEDVNRLSSEPELVSSGVHYIVVGKEVGENGTPHLQGCISFVRKLRMAAVKRIIGDTAHVEVCRDLSKARRYCEKENDFWTIGEDTTGPGSRSDLALFKASVKSGMFLLEDVREAHSAVYARYPRFVHEYIACYKPTKALKQHALFEWQVSLYATLIHTPNDREIIFVVDSVGNKGKTWFAHYFASLHKKVQIIVPGKKADMTFALNEDIRVLFVDAPRSKQGEYVQYDFLEEVKNGYVFSTKYESRMKRLDCCHVVVLMNEQPDLTKLSRDRYNIVSI